MKTKLTFTLVVILIMATSMFTSIANAQSSKTITFHTSAQCGMCKETIEGAMNFERGFNLLNLTWKICFLL